MTKCIMEFNEPLNLSIKKRPVAVVTPSSSNKSTTQLASTTVQQLIVPPAMTLSTANHLLHSHSSSLPSPSAIECVSLVQLGVSVGDTLPDCDRDPSSYETHVDGSDDNRTDTSTPNKESNTNADVNSMTTIANNQLHSPLAMSLSSSIDISSNLNLIDLIYGRSKSPGSATMSAAMAAATTTTTAINSDPIATHSLHMPKFAQAVATATGGAAKTLSIAEAAATLTAYLNQQQSLDIAKLHLERYLKVTNQYLQTTLDGANMTANEQINQLIRTNILTNKIAANNLISIINKLLEQNIISEYYFKHASRLLMPDYREPLPAESVDIKDSDCGEMLENKFKLSPPYSNSGHNSEKLNGDKEYGFDEDTTNPNNEAFDFEEKIKKETIPIYSNPFMSYLQMQLHRGYEQTLVGSHPNTTMADTSPMHNTHDTKKSKTHQRNEHVNSNCSNNISSHSGKSSKTAHQIAYDLSLNINNLRSI